MGTKSSDRANREGTQWPELDLSIEEIDEPVFQPQQIVPNVVPKEILPRRLPQGQSDSGEKE
jgi:hypothetical protein